MGSGVVSWVIGLQKLISPGKIIAWKGIKNREAGFSGSMLTNVQLWMNLIFDFD